MKNLKIVDRKLFFSIIGLIVLGFLYFNNTSKNSQITLSEGVVLTQEIKLKEYKNKIDSIITLNKNLTILQEELNIKLDSIKNVKTNFIQNTSGILKSIKNASMEVSVDSLQETLRKNPECSISHKDTSRIFKLLGKDTIWTTSFSKMDLCFLNTLIFKSTYNSELVELYSSENSLLYKKLEISSQESTNLASEGKLLRKSLESYKLINDGTLIKHKEEIKLVRIRSYKRGAILGVIGTAILVWVLKK